MRRITREEAKSIDRKAQDEFHISGLILMENAGLEVTRYSKKFLKNKLSKILIFCGRGNNAGDGFVAARHLINDGYKKVKVIVIKESGDFTKEAALNFKILSKLTNNILEFPKRFKLDKIKKELINTQLIIDALFGIGLKGAVRGNFKKIIELINACKKKVLSVDVPSGLDVNCGSIQGTCIQATMTVTFGLPKVGFYKNDGPRVCGKIINCPIVFPRKLLK